MTINKDKKVIIIAGPNGAGKTTFALEYLPKEAGCPLFVNADLIAEGISPFNPEIASFHAGRLMIGEIKRHAASGKIYARMIPEWQRMGYKMVLLVLVWTVIPANAGIQ